MPQGLPGAAPLPRTHPRPPCPPRSFATGRRHGDHCPHCGDPVCSPRHGGSCFASVARFVTFAEAAAAGPQLPAALHMHRGGPEQACRPMPGGDRCSNGSALIAALKIHIPTSCRSSCPPATASVSYDKFRGESGGPRWHHAAALGTLRTQAAALRRPAPPFLLLCLQARVCLT